MPYPIHEETESGFSHGEEDGYDIISTNRTNVDVVQHGMVRASFPTVDLAVMDARARVERDDEEAAPFKAGDPVIFNSTAADGPRNVATRVRRRLRLDEADAEVGFMFELEAMGRNLERNDGTHVYLQAYAEELRATPLDRMGFGDWLRFKGVTGWCVAARMTPALAAKGYTRVITKKQMAELEADYIHETGNDPSLFPGCKLSWEVGLGGVVYTRRAAAQAAAREIGAVVYQVSRRPAPASAA